MKYEWWMNSINHQATEALDDLPSKLSTADFPKYIQYSPIRSDVGKLQLTRRQDIFYTKQVSHRRETCETSKTNITLRPIELKLFEPGAIWSPQWDATPRPNTYQINNINYDSIKKIQSLIH